MLTPRKSIGVPLISALALLLFAPPEGALVARGLGWLKNAAIPLAGAMLPLVFMAVVAALSGGTGRLFAGLARGDGEPIGAINRVPAEGEARSNMHVGGTAARSVLTPREREICSRIGPLLRERGLTFTGIDVIGDWLTEINVTSPTGLQEIDRFDGGNTAALLWDRFEARAASGA